MNYFLGVVGIEPAPSQRPNAGDWLLLSLITKVLREGMKSVKVTKNLVQNVTSKKQTSGEKQLAYWIENSPFVINYDGK